MQSFLHADSVTKSPSESARNHVVFAAHCFQWESMCELQCIFLQHRFEKHCVEKKVVKCQYFEAESAGCVPGSLDTYKPYVNGANLHPKPQPNPRQASLKSKGTYVSDFYHVYSTIAYFYV